MSNANPASTLLIDVGGLSTTIACLTLDDPEETILWAPSPAGANLMPGGGLASQATRMKKIVETFGLAGLLVAEPVAGADTTPVDTALTILSACRDAIAAGCRTVVWPAHMGDDMDSLSRANDRVRLISGLLVAETPGAARNKRLRIETPFLDFTDERLRELAEDLRAPAAI